MAVLFNNTRRCVVPQVIEALERLQNEPEQLARERNQRYSGHPPPCSESGETTQPPSPAPLIPKVDKVYEKYLRHTALNKSKPAGQFQAQARREEDRLKSQRACDSTRRQTLVYNPNLDYRANAENNVRVRWLEQGIWGEEWGPPWPEGSTPGAFPPWGYSGMAPFHNLTYFTSAGRWGHEQSDPEPEPDFDSPEARIEWYRARLNPPKPPESPPRPIKYKQTRLGPTPVYRGLKPTVRDFRASRPLAQFLYQVSKERDWIQDEINYHDPGRVVDLDAMARESVKNSWIEDGIWRPEWTEGPGWTWAHEDAEESESEEEAGEASTASGAAAGRVRKPKMTQVLGGEHFAPKDWLVPRSISKANNDGPVAGEDRAAETRSGTGRKNKPGRQPESDDGLQGAEEFSDQSSRSSSSSFMEESRTIRDGFRKSRSDRVAEPARESQRRGLRSQARRSKSSVEVGQGQDPPSGDERVELHNSILPQSRKRKDDITHEEEASHDDVVEAPKLRRSVRVEQREKRATQPAASPVRGARLWKTLSSKAGKPQGIGKKRGRPGKRCE